MFSSPFPEYIKFFCQKQTDSLPCILHPEEEACLSDVSSAKRKDEFRLGRFCAHQALSEFGLSHLPILKNEETREPCWPENIRGSISHSGGYAAAAVGLASEIDGIGIDLESLSRKIDFNIHRHVCIEEETQFLKSLPETETDLALRIIFSAKESIFKCLYPISKTYLYFKDAHITINRNESRFEFEISKECDGITSAGFQHWGQFTLKNNMLLTSIFLKV